MKKFFKKKLKIAFLVILIFSFSVQPVMAGNYDDAKTEAQNEIYNAQQAIENLKTLKSDVDAYIQEIDANISQMDQNLNSIEVQCTGKQQEIDTSNAIIIQTEADIEQQYQDMKKRIKFMYENADTQYVEMILGAQNFSDFLNKADYFSKLTTYDREMIVKMEETKIQLEEQKTVLEQEKVSLEILKADAIAQKNEANLLLDEKENQMAKYSSQIDLEQKEIEAQQAILARINDLEASGGTEYYFGGQFTWPVPSSQYITSQYGWRINPFDSSKNQWHNGIDVGAYYGSNILAACSGTVIISAYGYNGGCGNFVAIDHGGGLSTVYFHCSSLLVNVGDFVIQGTPIALIGSTGSSTGSHLHFGVKSGNTYVNPMDYFGN